MLHVLVVVRLVVMGPLVVIVLAMTLPLTRREPGISWPRLEGGLVVRVV